MKIIDRETGKRMSDVEKEDKNKLKKDDPIKRFVEKGIEEGEEVSPMDPPEAYDAKYSLSDVDMEKMSGGLRLMMDEHKDAIRELEKFEASLIAFKNEGFQMSKEMNDTFAAFFAFFDNHVLPHNREEERNLFPILNKRLIESGEHSTEPIPKTAVDLMEDDHVKFIQLATLTMNLLGLAPRLPDQHSRALTVDLAYHNGIELVELMRLHIYREDKTLFPLTQKLLSSSELSDIEDKLKKLHEIT